MDIIKIVFLIFTIRESVSSFVCDTSKREKGHIISLQNDSNSLVEYLKDKHILGTVVSAYMGSVARIPCFGAAKNGNTLWMYTQSIHNLSFTPMQENELAVENGNLTIYYVQVADAGVYVCGVESSLSTLVILEVLDDEEKYTVVKPNTSLGPYSSPPSAVTSELTAFSSWAAWSECSRCGQVGRRRRYGYCFLRYEVHVGNGSNSNAVTLSEDEIKLFHAFPGGLPCRSGLLQKRIKNLPIVSSRKNEIMIGLCKVRCKSHMFEVRSPSGQVIERANNSDGVYSLRQRGPPQPPPVPRDIIFAAKGTMLVIKCPGTTLRDVPVTWRVGTTVVSPRELDIDSDGGTHIAAGDHLVVAAVRSYHAGVYSCWQHQNLAGVVKVAVFEDTRSVYGHRLTLIAVICCLYIVLRVAKKLYLYLKQY